MKLSGGEIVVRALQDEGIRFTFGIPGTHNIELYDALADSERIRPVLVTDEQSAGFMADGLWRASGSLGCVNLVPGAGLTHALSGIAEAYMDGVPMLVLPIVNFDNGQHAADENLRIGNLWDGIEMFASLLARVGKEWDARITP